MPIQGASANACSSNVPISKRTILAMLQAPSVIGPKPGQEATYIDPNGRTGTYRIASVGETSVWLEINGEEVEVSKKRIKTNTTPVFLDKLADNDWTVVSFDPRSRTACIAINNGKVKEMITVTLPVIR